MHFLCIISDKYLEKPDTGNEDSTNGTDCADGMTTDCTDGMTTWTTIYMDGRLLLTSVFIWRQIYVISPFLLFETGNIALNVFYSFYLLFWISIILRLESQLNLKFYQQNLQTQNFNCVWVRSYTKQYKKSYDLSLMSQLFFFFYRTWK